MGGRTTIFSAIFHPPSSIFYPLSTQLSATLAFAASLRMCFSNHAIR